MMTLAMIVRLRRRAQQEALEACRNHKLDQLGRKLTICRKVVSRN